MDIKVKHEELAAEGDLNLIIFISVDCILF